MIIGICDDDKNWCQQAGKIIEAYVRENSLDAELIYFENGEQLLGYEGLPFDVLFLDIEMEDEDGITVAGAVNEKWKNCQIVYLTNHLFYATEVYQTNHVFYALKEQFGARIGEIFQKVFHELQQKRRRLVFSVIGGRNIVLLPAEILYFERIKRVTVLQTLRGQYEVWDKLDELITKLPQLDFVRCHNSYIVYLPAVREMLKEAFIMNDGTKVMISRSYVKTAKNAFIRWAETQMP